MSDPDLLFARTTNADPEAAYRQLREALAAAEERGYQRAKAEDIAALRDAEVWRADDPHDEFGTGRFVVLTAAADFLEARTEGNPT